MRIRGTVSRRQLMAGGLILTAGTLSSLTVSAAKLLPTPRQTAGPFYPKVPPLDSDNDLVVVDGQPRQAYGQVANVMGRILDPNGRPVNGARVEIWQCDALGRYHHPGERRSDPDPYFQGYGQMTVGRDGAYRFRTLKPVPYPGRTPHIHFRISGSGIRALTTQMYIRGEPRNHSDFVLGQLASTEERESLMVTLKPAPAIEANSLAGTFDIVLGTTPSNG